MRACVLIFSRYLLFSRMCTYQVAHEYQNNLLSRITWSAVEKKGYLCSCSDYQIEWNHSISLVRKPCQVFVSSEWFPKRVLVLCACRTNLDQRCQVVRKWKATSSSVGSVVQARVYDLACLIMPRVIFTSKHHSAMEFGLVCVQHNMYFTYYRSHCCFRCILWKCRGHPRLPKTLGQYVFVGQGASSIVLVDADVSCSSELCAGDAISLFLQTNFTRCHL